MTGQPAGTGRRAAVLPRVPSRRTCAPGATRRSPSCCGPGPTWCSPVPNDLTPARHPGRHPGVRRTGAGTPRPLHPAERPRRWPSPPTRARTTTLLGADGRRRGRRCGRRGAARRGRRAARRVRWCGAARTGCGWCVPRCDLLAPAPRRRRRRPGSGRHGRRGHRGHVAGPAPGDPGRRRTARDPRPGERGRPRCGPLRGPGADDRAAGRRAGGHRRGAGEAGVGTAVRRGGARPPLPVRAAAARARRCSGCWPAGCCCPPGRTTSYCRARWRCTCAPGARTGAPSRCRRRGAGWHGTARRRWTATAAGEAFTATRTVEELLKAWQTGGPRCCGRAA